MAGIFGRVADTIPNELRRQIFFSLFHSRLTYALIIWYNTCENTTNALQTLQNKAIRNLFKYGNQEHIVDIHKLNQIPTLRQYADYLMAKLIHSMLNEHIYLSTSNEQRYSH